MKLSKPIIVFTVAIVLFAAAGCSAKKQKKQVSRQYRSTESMYAQARTLFESGELRKARQMFQSIEFTAENRLILEPLVRLGIADSTFYAMDDLSLIDARALYLDFVTLYGDHDRAPYAQLQAGVCSLKQVNHPSRDQKQTLEAIEDLKGVLVRYPDSPYFGIAQEMIERGRTNLAEHELIVARFYLKKKEYQATTTRLRNLLRTYPSYKSKDQVFFYLGKSLVLGGNEAEGKLYLDRLLEDYPSTKFAKEAGKLIAAAV